MIARLIDSGAAIVRPSFLGKSGHPVIYSVKVFDDILSMPPDETAKSIMAKYEEKTVFVEIDSDGILYDADTPGDFEVIKTKFF